MDNQKKTIKNGQPKMDNPKTFYSALYPVVKENRHEATMG